MHLYIWTGMSCAVTVDGLRTEPSARKCSTSSTSSAGSSVSSSSSSDDSHRDAASVAIVATEEAVMAPASGGFGGGSGSSHPCGRGGAGTAAVSSDAEIHTDRDYCSSDESNGPDSPTGLKRVGSVYDFGLDGVESPTPCSNSSNPFAAVGPDTDLTKVARKQLRMIREVDVTVCYLNHTNTIISKILSSKYLRRWENHQISLQDDCITSNTVRRSLSKIIYDRVWY